MTEEVRDRGEPSWFLSSLRSRGGLFAASNHPQPRSLSPANPAGALIRQHQAIRV